MPLALLAQGIEFHQIVCHFIDGTAYLRLGTLPFPGTQLVQFRLPGIRGSVFLDDIQPGGKDIEVSSVTVLYLDIVLDHTLHLNLVDTLVNAQAVALMHHVVPYLQLVEIFYLLPLVKLLRFLLFLRAENVRLREYHELKQRILEALVYVAVIGKHLPGKHLP